MFYVCIDVNSFDIVVIESECLTLLLRETVFPYIANL